MNLILLFSFLYSYSFLGKTFYKIKKGMPYFTSAYSVRC